MDTDSKITYSEIKGLTIAAGRLFNTFPLAEDDHSELARWLDETGSLLDRHLKRAVNLRAANSRITNAQRFLQSNEVGAAWYEVSQLLTTLQREFVRKTQPRD